MAVGMNQTLVFKGQHIDARITGNLTALQGAVLNLIQNASQISPKESTIQVQFRVSNRWLVVAVSDQGPGITDATKQKIFEPFFTTKTHGTGLGLAVVQSVAKAHQGKIQVTNLPEGGACFAMMLPRAFSSDVEPLTSVKEG